MMVVSPPVTKENQRECRAHAFYALAEMEGGVVQDGMIPIASIY